MPTVTNQLASLPPKSTIDISGDALLSGSAVITKKTLLWTVSFWQLVRAADGQQLEPTNWPSFIGELARRGGPKIRHDVEGIKLSGTVHTRHEVDHLVLTKDRDDLPRQQHTVTGQVTDMRTTGDDWVVIESAFITFLEFGNVFGFLQSANTAPSPQAVAKWINETKLLRDDLHAEPVVDPERWSKLKHAGGVTCLEIAASTNILNRDTTNGPIKYLSSLGKMDEFTVEVKITASRARKPGRDKQRRQLYSMTEAVISDIGLDHVHKAKAKIFDEDNQGIPADTINLIKQRITARCPVAIVGAGHRGSVSESSAFDAILSTLDKFEDDLRRAVGA